VYGPFSIFHKELESGSKELESGSKIWNWRINSSVSCAFHSKILFTAANACARTALLYAVGRFSPAQQPLCQNPEEANLERHPPVHTIGDRV